jgi:hypothetical protein
LSSLPGSITPASNSQTGMVAFFAGIS